MTKPKRRSKNKAKSWILSTLLALTLGGTLWAVTSSKAGVKWVGPEKAAAVAKKTGKPLLYDFTAEWCGPCRMLNKTIFEDAKASRFINANFVPVRVLDRYREEGKNTQAVTDLQRRFQLSGFPTLAVESADGKRQDLIVGFHGYEGTLQFLQRFLQTKP